jgi:hypothetical protein
VEKKFSSSKCASISPIVQERTPKPGHHLFIAPRTNMAVTPSLGNFSDRPDALHCVRSPCVVHVSLRVQHRTSDINGRLSVPMVKRVTGRSAQPTGRATPGVRFESSKGPLATGRVRSIVTGHAPRPTDLAICSPSRRLTGRAGPASDQTCRCETLARVSLQQLLLTGRAGRAKTASGSASSHLSDLRSPPFLSTMT